MIAGARSGMAGRGARGALVTVAVAAMLASGCGGSSSKTRTGQTEAPPKVIRAGSPQAALQRLWRLIAVGSPAAVTIYDPAFVEGAGRSRLLAALANQRGPIAAGKPRVVGQRTTPLGTEVVVRQTRSKGPAQQNVYLLHRSGGDWLVTYDGMLLEPLVAQASHAAIVRAQRPSKSSRKQPAPAAQAAAAVAGSKEREAINGTISVPRTGGDPARSLRAAVRGVLAAIAKGSPAAVTAYDPSLLRKLGVAEVLAGLQS